MSTVNDLNELAVLNSGRNPRWVVQGVPSSPNGPPSDASDGVSLRNSVVALLGASISASPGVVSIVMDVFDDSAEYTITVGSVTITADDISEEEALNTLAFKLDQGGISATYAASSGVIIIKTTEAVTVSATGSGELRIVGNDATEADIVLWFYTNGGWTSPANGALHLTRNFSDRAIVAGYERAYIEVVSTDGDVTLAIGPCVVED